MNAEITEVEFFNFNLTPQQIMRIYLTNDTHKTAEEIRNETRS